MALAREPYDAVLFVGDPEEHDAIEYEFPGDVRELCLRDHDSRLARIMGDEELASALTDAGVPGGEARLRTRAIDGADYVGSELSFRSGTQSAGLFVGILADLRGRLAKADLSKARETVERPSQESVAGRRSVTADQNEFAIVGDEGVSIAAWVR